MNPVIFIGHGSPMNAISDNEFTRGWKRISSSIPKPTAILSISAHWVTKGTKVLTLEEQDTIHDFYGFPKELYDIEYNAKGSPNFAKKTLKLLEGIADKDVEWGIDHGTWSVLHVMYPNADIPVFQLSIDKYASPHEIFQIGSKIRALRNENILIMGSGNIVHNLDVVDFSVEGGYNWANEFNNYIKDKIEKKDFESILNYKSLGFISKNSVPTTEHFNPLLYVLGATSDDDKVEVYNNSCIFGGLSMTSYIFTN